MLLQRRPAAKRSAAALMLHAVVSHRALPSATPREKRCGNPVGEPGVRAADPSRGAMVGYADSSTTAMGSYNPPYSASCNTPEGGRTAGRLLRLSGVAAGRARPL